MKTKTFFDILIIGGGMFWLLITQVFTKGNLDANNPNENWHPVIIGALVLLWIAVSLYYTTGTNKKNDTLL